jgi:hypothetical protein
MKTAVEKICETCRYWSELVIRSLGPKHSLKALCLNHEGPFYGRFCRGAERCPSWASGHLGAIDDPDLPEGAYASQGVAEPHNDADAAFDHLIELYETKYDKAVGCLKKDRWHSKIFLPGTGYIYRPLIPSKVRS